ncbi:MAG: hypothetical protein PG981_001496 [Wolbachia endosymbiont of Ctenocephalides orientis wCori]|nr:MAG: hypothetical protein PG981_001496 [Wolbachia endosymbiont of Ctenocephalides orientis wCori]
MKYDESKLWTAVITRGIQDAVGKSHTLKKAAYNWIYGSQSFRDVCDLANLDCKSLKNMLSKIIGTEGIMDFSSKKVLEIKPLLINNLKDCLSYLLPGGKFYSKGFYIGNINGEKIMVKTTGKKVGDWYNFNKKTKGDIIKLWTLVLGDINLAEEWVKRIEKTPEKVKALPLNKTTAFSVGQYLNDQSPMSRDIIAPRILTPGGLLVIGGTPKVGKSNLLLSLLVHLAAGVSFLGMKLVKPLKIFYLQNEMEYDYIRERLQQLRINQKFLDIATENLAITPKMKLTLNSEGIEKMKEIIAEKFDTKTVDLIVIDSLYNVVDCGNNRSMLNFLQDGIEKLRSITNPAGGIILTHHTKKVPTTVLAKNPFQSLSGAGVLRSFYTSGIVMFRPNEHKNILQVMYELRNGRLIPIKFINEANGHWKMSNIVATA